MKTIQKFIDVLLLNPVEYPHIDLQGPEVVSAQFENITKFKARQYPLLLTIGIVVLEVLSFNILGNYLAIDTKTTTFGLIAFAAVFISVSFFIFFMFKYKCPHCGTIPAGTAIGVGLGVSYTKGINPFPQRCTCCGFYLSKRPLSRDIAKLKATASVTACDAGPRDENN